MLQEPTSGARGSGGKSIIEKGATMRRPKPMHYCSPGSVCFVGKKHQIPATFYVGEGSNSVRLFVGESAKRRRLFLWGEAPNHNSHNYANGENMTRRMVVREYQYQSCLVNH